MTNADKLVSTSDPPATSPDNAPDNDSQKNTPAMLDEPESDKSLPDIAPPSIPLIHRKVIPEIERDLEKFYCEYCTDNFFTKDGLRQHTGNAHFRELDRLYGDKDEYVQHKNAPKPTEDYSRGRKRKRQESVVKERNDSVSRRKRVKGSKSALKKVYERKSDH